MELTTKTIFSNPVHFLAFGFGSGLSPYAPGTMGTLAAVPIYLVLQWLPWYLYLVALVVILVSGVWICDETSRHLGVHDHPGIVWDEIGGFLLTMFLVPVGWIWLILGFGLFRLFDIWKPWPILMVDKKVKGGFGIMLDDVLAAIYAWVCLQAVVLVAAYY